MGTSCWAINLPIWQINRLMLATFWPNISPLALQEVSCPPTFVHFFGRFFPDRRFHYPIDKVPMVWPPQSWVFYTCDRSPRSLGDSLWPVQNPALLNVITSIMCDQDVFATLGPIVFALHHLKDQLRHQLNWRKIWGEYNEKNKLPCDPSYQYRIENYLRLMVKESPWEGSLANVILWHRFLASSKVFCSQ